MIKIGGPGETRDRWTQDRTESPELGHLDIFEQKSLQNGGEGRHFNMFTLVVTTSSLTKTNCSTRVQQTVLEQRPLEIVLHPGDL